MTVRIVLFARQPAAGEVKTRLVAGVGEAAAAAVYAELLDHASAVVERTGMPWSVSLAEPADPRWTAALAADTELQVEGDLGRRMHACLQRWFDDGAARVVIVGSDIPGLAPGHLLRALEALDEHEVVLGPSGDGGYWLMGQRAPGVDCFTGVPWSSSDTLAATRSRLEDLGVDWAEIDTLPDIDTADDLQRALDDADIDPSLRHRLRSLLG